MVAITNVLEGIDVLRRILHYLVVVTRNEGGNDPTLLFYDLFLFNLNSLETVHFSTAREGGSVFVMQGRVIYAEGQYVNISFLLAVEALDVFRHRNIYTSCTWKRCS
ncbi:hypothetical protein DQ04_00351130 [Trypanosoma grayi]|uniref:hypothetical protein n=1 Tax=Trypanosoma grayi TaxID=71804 RepID=UPI0004F4B526|nr:hypothetical protein DQ04_00351130 [Trypanosoma grayi]KEG14676.1 hypothetical protein DQ04_00351130 [Trypanosoma grayi]